MSTLVVGVPARRGRGFRLGVALGFALPLSLLGLSLLPGGDASPSGAEAAHLAQRSALVAFEEALEPVADDGATTVVYGMRPGIADIAQGSFADETLVTMAMGWVRSMEAVRDDFREVEAPGFLSEAARLYAESFDAYVETARALLAAAQAEGDERAGHVTAAADHGRRADDLYDAAKAAVEAERLLLGGTW